MGSVEDMGHLIKPPVENGHSSHRIVLPKFKKRKVSVVRDFPPGCGRNAQVVNSRMKEAAVPSVGTVENKEGMSDICDALPVDESKVIVNEVEAQYKEKVCDDLEMVTAKTLGSEADSETTEAIKNLVPMDVPIPSNSLEHENGKALVSHDTTQEEKIVSTECLGIDFPTGGDNKGLVELSNDLEFNVPKLLKDSHHVEFLDSVKSENGMKMEDALESEAPHAVVSLGCPKSQSPPKSPNVSLTVGNNMNKSYPPPRRISAIRDFPPLCGRNAPLASKEQRQKAIASSERNNSRPKKSVLSQGDAFRKKLGAGISQDIDDEVPSDSGKDASLQAQFGTSSAIKVVDQGEIKGKTAKTRWVGNLHQEGQKSHNAYKSSLASGVNRGKVKNFNFAGEERKKSILKTKRNHSEVTKGKSTMKKPPPIIKCAHEDTQQNFVDDVDSISEDDKEHEKYHLVQRSTNTSVCLPPFGVSSSGGGDQDATITRNKVRESLRLFQAICRKLSHGNEAKGKGDRNSRNRVDLLAAGILKSKGKYVNTGKKIMGSVPGVEVGDEFHYRVELNIVGLHRHTQGGIDYTKVGKVILATSIVSSGGYADDLENSDTLIYTGSGGNVMQGDKEPEDQKLERGNLALKNSAHEKNHVRVIRGIKESKASETSNGRVKAVMTYTYDGLYLVEKYWQEMGPHGKLVFKFQLSRIPGQPALAWKEVKKANKSTAREGLCLSDVSQGKELMPICAVNVLDDEKPPQFKYITRMIYPSWYHLTPPEGCNCINGCSDSERCSCAVKNGGEIPYNHNGDIVEAKPLVFECGPSCKCPPSCHNRVTQRGTKFQLEVFKTESRGWGVRSLNSIPSGSFICEYIGELLDDKEAELRLGNDEYLFDIGHNYNDRTLWDGLSGLTTLKSSEGTEEAGFTIDAAKFGNVGRFFNHSCSPNLYAQSVLYDHEEKKMPHIMFFAAENIPPLQELTYHYNYTIGQVRDSNGDIKTKPCYCGSSECTGRMY